MSEALNKLLTVIYKDYPEGASSMPDDLSEAVINALAELDKAKAKAEGGAS